MSMRINGMGISGAINRTTREIHRENRVGPRLSFVQQMQRREQFRDRELALEVVLREKGKRCFLRIQEVRAMDPNTVLGMVKAKKLEFNLISPEGRHISLKVLTVEDIMTMSPEEIDEARKTVDDYQNHPEKFHTTPVERLLFLNDE